MSDFRIDYLKFTVFDVDPISFWGGFYEEKLGKLVDTGHGGLGYTRMYRALAGATVYTEPKEGKYFTVEFKGMACSCLTPLDMQVVPDLANSGIKINITRIDFAWDNVDFTPRDFYNVLLDGEFKSASTRGTITWWEKEFEEKENGDKGTHTCYLGSRKSGRMLRVYDKHGFTRVELELKEEWSRLLGMEILKLPFKDWNNFALGCLVRYFNCGEDWWMSFTNDTRPNEIIVYSARIKSLDKACNWLIRQVSPAFFAVQAVIGLEDLQKMIFSSIMHNPERLDRWQSVMQVYG